MPTLLWFRRDLRLSDNPALLAAAADGDDVLACFVLDDQLRKTSGDRRLQYLHDALSELDDKLDGRLLVTRGKPESRIPKLAKEIGATAVHAAADFTPYGLRRDDAVRDALGDIAFETTGSPYLVSPGRIAKDDGSPYKVFSPFFKEWQKHGWRDPATSKKSSASWIDPKDVAGGTHMPDPGVTLDIAAGEDAARTQWKGFLSDGVDDYADARNRPDLEGTSRMSAHLKFGTIHPRTMAADLGKGKGPQAYLRELCFRDFYAEVLREWPESRWWNFNSNFDELTVDDDAAARKRLETWKAGRTGFPIVDAGMRQLSQSGYMHNRVRMIVASFLVKDLHLPWQWGARHFLDQLVDGDIANNAHGWQWVAGTGTDASPFFRVFNPAAQGEKFDPDGAYVKRWVSELADVDDVHALSDADADGRPEDYPEPMVVHKAEREEALRRYEDTK